MVLKLNVARKFLRIISISLWWAIERRQNVNNFSEIYFVFKRVAPMLNCLKPASPFLAMSTQPIS